MELVKETLAIASFGQHLHWSQLQFNHFKTYGEDSTDADYNGTLILWLASLYVVADAWKELGKSDETISSLLENYEDYFQSMRRFRNAVYHYQPTPFCDKLSDFLRPTSEVLAWATALQFEFQRALLSIVPPGELADEVKLMVGWWPEGPLLQRKADGQPTNLELNPSLRFLTRIPNVLPNVD